MEKVTHDATNRLIIVTDSPAGGLITIDVLSELYSASKREWLADDTLNRLTFPWVPEGGTVLPSGQTTPRSFILRDPWKLRPYEADHNLVLTGNVFAETGSLTVPTLGNFRVEILSVFDVGLGDPPILVGGNGARTLQRVIRYGDEWMPLGRGGMALGDRIQELQELAAKEGRAPIPVSIFGTSPDPAEVELRVKEGASRVVFNVRPAPADQALPKLDQLAEIAGKFS